MPPNKRKEKPQTPEKLVMPVMPKPPDITRPPRDSTAFFHFIDAFRKRKETGENFTKTGEDGMSEWLNMSDNDKAPYIKAAENQLNAFRAYTKGASAADDKRTYDEYAMEIEVYRKDRKAYDESVKKRRKLKVDG